MGAHHAHDGRAAARHDVAQAAGRGQWSPTPAPTPAPTPGFGAPPATTTGPVTGVYSLSKKKAFRLFDGRDVYDEWRFTEQTLLNQGPPLPTGAPGPGIGR